MSSSEEEVVSVVIDFGSGTCKAGFAGDDSPRSFDRTLIGRPLPGAPPAAGKECYVGDAALKNREMLSLKYPLQHGIVSNWDDMEKIIHYTLDDKLRVMDTIRDTPILFTEPVLNPKGNREKMAEVLLEKFEAAGTYAALKEILAVYASGRGSALAVQSGHGVTTTLGIYEGHCPRESIQRVDTGGGDIAAYLASMLAGKGHSFHTTADLETANLIKEEHAYVASDFNAEVVKAREGLLPRLEESYALPDGQSITLGEERFYAGEALFQPSLLGLGKDVPGIHQMAHKALMALPVDVRRDLSCNIVLSGANTMIPGSPERMRAEMTTLCGGRRAKVIVPPERRESVWIGGSILASLSLFQNWFITRSDYHEHGPECVNRRVG